MSKVITFSQTFPKGHPREGDPTFFVEKFWNAIKDEYPTMDILKLNEPEMDQKVKDFLASIPEEYASKGNKSHTVRAGHRWNVGDMFSPRVWSGVPYNSPQIKIGPDIEVKKVWNFKVKDKAIFINEKRMTTTNVISVIEKVAMNDGLSFSQFLAWFKYPKDFDGQIICWKDSVNY